VALTYDKDYWDDLGLKREFMDFLIRIHNLDLSLWDRLGYWDRQYRPFSFFSGDTLVSNVCLYSMDMSVLGKRCRVAQISAVGTLPEFRRQGLSRQLTEKAMDWARADHDFFFLFADEEAFPFYERCGFRHVDEHAIHHPVQGMARRPGATKLDMQRQDHRDLVYHIAADREPVSDLLGICNERLLMFWCLYFLKDDIYYIEALDAVVLCRREGDRLTVFDIVAQTLPSFSAVYPYVAAESDRLIEFLFMTDRLGLDRYKEVKLSGDNGTHLCGDFPLAGGRFIFPYTCHA
jgi:GNAT superfamily N-acetyltransferase